VKGDIGRLLMVLQQKGGMRDFGAVAKLKFQSNIMFIRKGEMATQFLIRLKKMNRVLETEQLGWGPEELVRKFRHGVGNYISVTLKLDADGNFDFEYSNSPYTIWCESVEGEERMTRRPFDLEALENSLEFFERNKTRQYLEGGPRVNPRPVVNGLDKDKPLRVDAENKVSLAKKKAEEKKTREEKNNPKKF
jgi:hypothetical protein